MNLSKNFTLDELTVSQEAARSGLKNIPNADQTESLRLLCENILQPLRDRARKPLVVSSGFRSVSVNRRIGGSATSQHCKGQAADFTIPGLSVADTVELIRKMGLPVDQCIEEFGRWVHVSYGPRHRKQFLKARRVGGKTQYQPL
jgi:zinc D-Ala-D-Ala carboxypeptidase